MTTVYIGIAALLGVLFLAWRLVAAYNAPKTEAEKSRQAEIAKEKARQRQEANNERRDDRAANRRRGGRSQPSIPPAIETQPAVPAQPNEPDTRRERRQERRGP